MSRPPVPPDERRNHLPRVPATGAADRAGDRVAERAARNVDGVHHAFMIADDTGNDPNGQAVDVLRVKGVDVSVRGAQIARAAAARQPDARAISAIPTGSPRSSSTAPRPVGQDAISRRPARSRQRPMLRRADVAPARRADGRSTPAVRPGSASPRQATCRSGRTSTSAWRRAQQPRRHQCRGRRAARRAASPPRPEAVHRAALGRTGSGHSRRPARHRASGRRAARSAARGSRAPPKTRSGPSNRPDAAAPS